MNKVVNYFNSAGIISEINSDRAKCDNVTNINIETRNIKT